jgi:hypothetical protein
MTVVLKAFYAGVPLNILGKPRGNVSEGPNWLPPEYIIDSWVISVTF